jgi:chromosome partitioning protein
MVQANPAGSPNVLAERVRTLGLTPTAELMERLRRAIVTVAAWKGGVGKSTLAYELAWLLAAVLVDLEWDGGGVTREWGYRHQARVNMPLLDALDTGRTPRPLHWRFRPDLVPGHPDFGVNQPPEDTLTNALEKWAADWQQPVVIDTHPGGVTSTYGAVAAANLVVVPTTLGKKDLEALAGMLDGLHDYRLLLIPTMVPSSPPERGIARLEALSKQFDVPVGPPISEYRWVRWRQRRMAITASPEPVPLRARPMIEELRKVAREVINHVGHAAA